MADIQIAQKNTRRKTADPRIDLAPMVDLGFLLITFFMYTTSMAKLKTMEIDMPYKSQQTTTPTAFPEESTLTLIATKNHKLLLIEGSKIDEAKLITQQELRPSLIDHAKAASALPATFSKEAHQLHVIIKPNDDSSYEDLVSILDEMTINAVPYYAIVDITAEDQQLLTNKLQNNVVK
ncbi:MAG: biopolymer transporter ExbD [Sphingobacteriales bacterium]|nr:MAG: biopolymer transporter ExbD [Sphingobacteriales bacterium]